MLVLQATLSIKDIARLAVIYMGKNKTKTITVLDEVSISTFSLGEGNVLTLDSRR